MIPFLKQIAARVAAEPELSEKTIVFPNRRSILFFRHYLLEHIDKTVRAPKLFSIEHFFVSHSTLVEPERLALIHRLHGIYSAIMSTTEPFYRFHFWGDVLLGDFDELDKALVDTSRFFRDLRNLKEIDASFDFMTEEQKTFLKTFWRNAGRKHSPQHEKFLKIWQNLPTIYTQFTASILRDHLGYEGLIQRHVVDALEPNPHAHHTLFVGFNALTRAEEKLMCHYVEQGANIYWDIDAYYMNDPRQEAGRFFRRYQKHPILARTFTPAPSGIKEHPKTINLVSVPQHVEQTRVAGQQLSEALLTDTANTLPGSTIVVMPDETLLFPMLYALPQQLPSVNVTMGYPIQHTALYRLLDRAIVLQQKQQQNRFYHQSVTELLTHAYVRAFDAENSDRLSACIVEQHQIYIPCDDLQQIAAIGPCLFAVVEPKEALSYLLNLVTELGRSFTDKQYLDQQCADLLYRHIAHMHALLHDDEVFADWNAVQQFFSQIFSSTRTPFAQEGVEALQVMGMLETRNLDFEHVHILSLNEGLLPSPQQRHSYIPYHLRKAYGLLTHEDHDAMYAYLFYRLLHRAKTVWMYYTTQVGMLGSREMSRYVKQLIHESGLPIVRRLLHDEVNLSVVEPITIVKTEAIKQLLEKYRSGVSNSLQRKLTPSALNDYLDCRLRFYFKHIVNITAPDKVEDVDMRVFGLLLHEAACIFYEHLSRQNKGQIVESDLRQDNPFIARSIDEAFEQHCPDYLLSSAAHRGKYRVVYVMVEEWLKKIIERDRSYAPFKVLGLEKKFTVDIVLPAHNVLLGGIIDRIDHRGGITRIIDYKTGGDELVVPDIASLFSRDDKRNKAAFQTFFYSYLYFRTRASEGEKIMPGLMNRKNLFDSDFIFGHLLKTHNSIVEDIRIHVDVFEDHLRAVLNELYDPAVPFTQTTYMPSCAFCSYRSLCSR